MKYLIGTDEAGYGPNLGPLVISASVWQVPQRVGADDLYAVLEGVVTAAAGSAGDTAPDRIVIADSKAVYQSGKGLSALERGVLTALALLGRRPATWRDVWAALAPDSSGFRRLHPWYADYDAPLPLEASCAEIEALAVHIEQGLRAAGVRLVGLSSRVVFEAEFNRLVERHGSKGTLLSLATLELAAQSLAPLGPGPISVVCDKHGGRNRYRDLLMERFPDWLVEVYGEGRQESLYRFGPPERRVEFRFRAKGERCLATALASMASKYLRELAMRAFNAFWCSRVAGLAPTAGYPDDAGRFRTSIAAAQAGLGIADGLLWRCR
jgi:hypothetical protein